MADPINLVTQYERQLAGAGEPAREFAGAVERGYVLGNQRRAQRLNERLVEGQIKEMDQRLSINDQLLQNPNKLIDEFGDLKTTEERLKFIARNSGIGVTPHGAKVLSQLESITDQMAKREVLSAGYQAKLATVKNQAEIAAKYGVDPDDEEGMAFARQSEEVQSLFKDAVAVGRELDASQIPADAWLPGGRIDPVKRISIINSAPLKAKPIELSNFGQMLIERNAAFRAGDMESVKRYDAYLAEKGMTVKTNPDGTVEITQGPTGASGGKETEAMANARIYATRMANSERVFDELIKEGFDPTAFFSGAGTLLPNAIQTEQVQRWQNAADNLISAVLRKESGASISDPERASAYSEYIPRFGDQKGTVSDKSILRRKYLEQMEKSGGISTPAGASSLDAPNAPASVNPPGTIADGSPEHPFTTEEEVLKARPGAYYMYNGKRYRKK